MTLRFFYLHNYQGGSSHFDRTPITKIGMWCVIRVPIIPQRCQLHNGLPRLTSVFLRGSLGQPTLMNHPIGVTNPWCIDKLISNHSKMMVSTVYAIGDKQDYDPT